MNWENIVGQKKTISILKNSIAEKRIAHATLFLGKEGYGVLPLALAYAKEIFLQENENSGHKVDHLNHLDLHFSFPVFSINKQSLSRLFFEQWRDMILENPYASFDDWTEVLDAENKQFMISVGEVEEVVKNFQLKSFEGGTKILIFWKVEKMTADSANKLLKFLEEPPEKTLIFLLAETTDSILPTILSRCQTIEVPMIEEEEIDRNLLEIEPEIDEVISKSIAFSSQGNWNTAIHLLYSVEGDDEFESLFILWVRNAFQAKKKPEVLKEIVYWAREIASWNREKQKKFLDYSLEIFRLALLQNYNNQNLVYKRLVKDQFQWDKFSTYIHGANIEAILDEISLADLHLVRNANAKLLWTDLGIKLTRYIHRSAN